MCYVCCVVECGARFCARGGSAACRQSITRLLRECRLRALSRGCRILLFSTLLWGRAEMVDVRCCGCRVLFVREPCFSSRLMSFVLWQRKFKPGLCGSDATEHCQNGKKMCNGPLKSVRYSIHTKFTPPRHTPNPQ